LPGFRYSGPEPAGFMTAAELVAFLDDYTALVAAPVLEHTTVRSVSRRDSRFHVATNRGSWSADAVVVATGATARPHVPALAASLSRDIAQFTPATYKRPEQLPAGNVLVVGASASGAQLASELRASGREVVLAVGRHIRLPRRYRGADILTWFDRAGILSDPASGVRDIEAARRQPSLQLVGSTPPRDLDLDTLRAEGVRLAGHLVDVDGDILRFADDVQQTVDDAHRKLEAVLSRIDPVADVTGAAPEPHPRPTPAPATPTRLDARAEGITSVVWATGYERSYPWLHLPVLDERGEIRQTEGITAVGGLYTVGLRFQRVRQSNFIGGVGGDAAFVAGHIAAAVTARAA
jgi:putative flavoprotein involved in K+ transport